MKIGAFLAAFNLCVTLVSASEIIIIIIIIIVYTFCLLIAALFAY